MKLGDLLQSADSQKQFPRWRCEASGSERSSFYSVCSGGRQCVRGSGRGRGGVHSFFRRLYMSLLLRSPAQVRLLRRNFLRSSLWSSWCMGT